MRGVGGLYDGGGPTGRTYDRYRGANKVLSIAFRLGLNLADGLISMHA